MSAAGDVRHHRVILHLHQGASEQAIIRVAAELAQLLGLELHGVYLDDPALPELAAFPFVREFRLATGSWHALDRAQLVREQTMAADEARRLLDDTAAALGVARLFEVISGDPMNFIAASSQAGDIIVVSQPRLPAERLVHATAHLLEAVHGCAGSVMLVPQVPTRRRGPVAAVVCAESDPALLIASHIAIAAGEDLLLLVSGPPELARQAKQHARAAGVLPQRITVRAIADVTPDSVLDALGAGNERLVVLARGACGADDAAVSAYIVAARGVPVLVAEP
jgi:hypothetical protein